MAKARKRSEFWDAVVAEAREGGQSRAAVASKHGVTEAALKYHYYKDRKATTPRHKRNSTASTPFACSSIPRDNVLSI